MAKSAISRRRLPMRTMLEVTIVIYSLLSLTIVLAHSVAKRQIGFKAYSDILNRHLGGKKWLVLVQLSSYGVAMYWVVLVWMYVSGFIVTTVPYEDPTIHLLGMDVLSSDIRLTVLLIGTFALRAAYVANGVATLFRRGSAIMIQGPGKYYFWKAI